MEFYFNMYLPKNKRFFGQCPIFLLKDNIFFIKFHDNPGQNGFFQKIARVGGDYLALGCSGARTIRKPVWESAYAGESMTTRELLRM